MLLAIKINEFKFTDFNTIIALELENEFEKVLLYIYKIL